MTTEFFLAPSRERVRILNKTEIIQLVMTITPERALLAFFKRVARKNAVQLEKLAREPRFRVDPEHWSFTLPDLHAFLQEQGDVFGRINYKKFRQIIFASPLNRILKSHGAEIVITDNRGKVDRSRYTLVWRD